MRSGVEVHYRTHGPSLLRYLTRMSGDPEVASDVLQDTFQRLLERPPPDRSNLRGWLFRVATNRLRDLQRRRGRRTRALQRLEPSHLQADAAPSPLGLVERRESRERVLRALESLPARDRQILLLREEGFTHREIAEAVDTTTGSVGTMIARALDKLERAWPTQEATP